jgi:hypothetical protein
MQPVIPGSHAARDCQPVLLNDTRSNLLDGRTSEGPALLIVPGPSPNCRPHVTLARCRWSEPRIAGESPVAHPLLFCHRCTTATQLRLAGHKLRRQVVAPQIVLAPILKFRPNRGGKLVQGSRMTQATDAEADLSFSA